MKMMKKAGFTLVELIVVITILAILGTIAFISLQGNTQDAKNSKVVSDVRSLASVVETTLTKGETSLASMVASGSGTAIAGASTIGTDAGSTVTAALAATPVQYAIGAVNYTALRQSSQDFDDDGTQVYVMAWASDVTDSQNTFYQIGGQTLNNAGTYDYVLKGNFITLGSAEGLIANSTDTNGVQNGDTGTTLLP